jgi:hypothetical protein
MTKPIRTALLLSALALAGTMIMPNAAQATHGFEFIQECDPPLGLYPPATIDDTNYSRLAYYRDWKAEKPQQGQYLGTQHITNYGGATVSFTLPQGPYQFAFGYTKMRNAGKAAIYYNGAYVTTIDMYAPTTQTNCTLILYGGVPAGTFMVKVLNQRNPLSTGSYVNIDYIHYET